MRESDLCTESPKIRQLLETAREGNQSVGRFDDNPLVLPAAREDLDVLWDYRFSLK